MATPMMPALAGRQAQRTTSSACSSCSPRSRSCVNARRPRCALALAARRRRHRGRRQAEPGRAGAGADRRRARARPGRHGAPYWRSVAAPLRAGRRLLVPAQPDRRRQPAAVAGPAGPADAGSAAAAAHGVLGRALPDRHATLDESSGPGWRRASGRGGPCSRRSPSPGRLASLRACPDPPGRADARTRRRWPRSPPT